MAIHLANNMVTFPIGICEDLLVRIDKFVFPANFGVLDMEEDNQVPIIIRRPFLSPERALVDIRESKLTLRVGEDGMTFGVDRVMKHSKICDNLVFSMDIFDALLEKEMQGWKNNDSKGYMTLKDIEFDAEHDLAELERLLEESEFEEIQKQAEDSPWRGNPVASWPNGKLRSVEKIQNTMVW